MTVLFIKKQTGKIYQKYRVTFLTKWIYSIIIIALDT